MRKHPTKIASFLLAGVLATGVPVCAAAAVAPMSLADPATSSSTSSSSSESGQTEKTGDAGDEASSDDADADGKIDTSKTDKQLKDAAKKAGEKAKKATEKAEEQEKASSSNNKDGKASSKKKNKQSKAEIAKRKQVVRAAAYLQTLNSQLETASEELVQIRAKRKKAQKKAKSTSKQLADARYAYTHARKSLNVTVKEIYENGDLSFFSVLLGANNFDDFASRLYLLESIASQREGTMSRTQALKSEYESKLEQYQKELDEVKDLEQQASKRKTTITDSITSQLKLIGTLDSSMLNLVNSYDTYKATRKWLSKFYGSKSKKGSHPEIVKIASEYLGVPYVWGGESPSGFDCSGLTMYCYAKIGISLPHNARAQYDCGKHIAEEALMPGDLVFFGPDVEGIHHVGIYVGAGKYLQAPRTGDVVKVSSLSDRSDYVGACRPGA